AGRPELVVVRVHEPVVARRTRAGARVAAAALRQVAGGAGHRVVEGELLLEEERLAELDLLGRHRVPGGNRDVREVAGEQRGGLGEARAREDCEGGEAED